MIDITIPEGAISPEAEHKLLARLTDILIEQEGEDPTNKRNRALAKIFLLRPAQLYIAGLPAKLPHYKVVASVPEGQFNDARRSGMVAAVTEAVLARKVDAIGVYRNDIRDKFLTGAGFTNLERTNDNILAFKMLMAGRTSMYASSATTVKSQAESAGFSGNDVKLVYVFMKTQTYIAVSKKTDPKIEAEWNAALKSMKQDGTFKGIFKKYFPDLSLPGSVINKF